MEVPLPSLLLALAAAVLGALFVAADSALGSLSTARIAALLEQSDLPHGSALVRYQKRPMTLHSTYVVGRVICAALTAILLAEVVEPVLPGRYGTLLALFAAVTIYAPISSLTAEMARRNADAWGLALASYLRPFEYLLLPMAGPLALVTESLADRIKEPDSTNPGVASAEVEYFVDEVERSGVVGAEPAEIIRNVLEFEDRRARDVMVPRLRVEGIELSTPLDEVRRLVAESGHSRYPVFEGQLDNVIGILVAKDVFKAEVDVPDSVGRRTLAEVIRRDVIFAHEQQKLVSLLREMRQKRQHLAVIVDEFGGTSGIVTLEDIIEEIVGDIRDEHDDAEAPLSEIGPGRWVAASSMTLDDLAAFLALTAPMGELGPRTLGSLFESSSPSAGETVKVLGIELVARDLDNDIIARVEVIVPTHSAAKSGAPPSLDAPAESDREELPREAS